MSKISIFDRVKSFIEKRKKRCYKCSRFVKDYPTAARLFYLNRPTPCFASDDSFDFNQAKKCDQYTTEKVFEENFGAIERWEKDEDSGDIYPALQDQWVHDAWFRYGFRAATKLFLNKEFKKGCGNCWLSNQHVISRCEKTELCERHEIDYMRIFDKKYYGHLCDNCGVKNCPKKEDEWSDFAKNYCAEWVNPANEGDD